MKKAAESARNDKELARLAFKFGYLLGVDNLWLHLADANVDPSGRPWVLLRGSGPPVDNAIRDAEMGGYPFIGPWEHDGGWNVRIYGKSMEREIEHE